ncbi:hypothetical protein ACFQ0B_17245 [Nonomuraea thailandensis]
MPASVGKAPLVELDLGQPEEEPVPRVSFREGQGGLGEVFGPVEVAPAEGHLGADEFGVG